MTSTLDVICCKCKGSLEIKDLHSSHSGHIILQIEPCDDEAHYDCSNCGDLTQLKEENKRLKEKISRLEMKT